LSRYLIDSDAFNVMRSLGLLSELCARLPPDQPLLMMGYPANVELNPLQREIAALKASGKLVVHDVVKKSPAGELMKKLIRQGVDKGEAEAISWAVESFDRHERPIFVSLDVNARKHASNHQLVAVDMMGAIVEWVEEGLLDRAKAVELTVVWDDRVQVQGRPSDYETFDHTYAHRLVARKQRLGI
jgi:predicted nucleic acid-binding protein